MFVYLNSTDGVINKKKMAFGRPSYQISQNVS
jgi:hypothetical protein